jgi:hypothetical protein
VTEVFPLKRLIGSTPQAGIFQMGAAADSTSVFPSFGGKSRVFLEINGLKRS